MNELLSKYEQQLVKAHKSFTTIRSYLSSIKQFDNFINQTKCSAITANALTKTDIEKYLKHLKLERKNMPSTINIKLYAIRSFLDFLYQCDNTIVNVAKQVPPVLETKKQQTFLTSEEIRTLLKRISNPMDQFVLQFLALTGLRINECLSLQVNDVSLLNRTIIVKHAKGHKTRTIPIGDSLFKGLKQYLEMSTERSIEDLLFVNHLGKAYTAIYFNRLLAKTVKELKWTKHITCHTFRHSFATNLIHKGVNTPTVAQFLGHNDYRVVTSTYIHIDEPVMKEAINLLEF